MMTSRRVTLLILVAALAALWSSCTGARAELVRAAVQEALGQVGSSWSAAGVIAESAALDGAVVQARDQLDHVVGGIDLDPDAMRALAYVMAVEAGDAVRADALVAEWTPPEDDLALQQARVRHLLLSDAFEPAQQLAWSLVEAHPDARAESMRLWYETFTAMPGFVADEPRTIVPGEDVDRIEHLERGTSLMFTFRHDGSRTHAFKPDQTVRVTNVRGEIASWRLCPLIHCVGSVPYSEEVRVSRDDFVELTGLASADEIATAFVREHSELEWHTDDAGEVWLYGVLKDWVPGFVKFAIEYVDVWMEWTNISQDAADLRRVPFAEAIIGLQTLDPERYLMILDRARGLTAYDLAWQIADMHVIDVLTNNWDRYRETSPGANAQWNHEQFVTIDFGATFQVNEEEHAFRGVQYRIDRVHHFSRRTIDAIRWMEPEALFPILFPPSPLADRDEERFAYFLERRQWLLDYVDGLVERHGEEAVYLFP